MQMSRLSKERKVVIVIKAESDADAEEALERLRFILDSYVRGQSGNRKVRVEVAEEAHHDGTVTDNVQEAPGGTA